MKKYMFIIFLATFFLFASMKIDASSTLTVNENSNGNIPIDTLENIAYTLKVEPYLLIKKQKHPKLPKRVNMK